MNDTWSCPYCKSAQEENAVLKNLIRNIEATLAKDDAIYDIYEMISGMIYETGVMVVDIKRV